MRTKVLLADRYYVPLSIVDRDAMKREFEVPIETKKFCRDDCPLSAKRGRYCSTCPSKEAKIKMWERVNSPKGKKLVALPSGDRQKVLAILTTRKIKIVDRRPTPKFRSALKWRGKLRKKGDVDDKGRPYADQRGMVRAWRDHVDSGETGGTIISPPRCVVGSTLVTTTRGLTRISDWARNVAVGEHAGPFHLRGRETPLRLCTEAGSAVVPDQLFVSAPESVYRVRLRHGLEVVGTADHPIRTIHGWTKLVDVRVGDVVPVYYNQRVWGTSKRLSEDLARFLGFWVSEGSGSTRSVHVTNYDDDVRELCKREILRAFPRAEIRERARAGSDPVLGLKRCVGTSDPRAYAYFDELADGLWRKSADKVIPRSVLESPEHVVCAFLQALFEGDGSVGKHRVGYASLSKTLIDQLRVVLANLGIVCSTRRRMSWATNGTAAQVSKPYWALGIKNAMLARFQERVGFFSEHKRAKLQEAVARFERLARHQPAWHEVFPNAVREEFVVLVGRVNEEWGRFLAQRKMGGGLNRFPVSFSSEVSNRMRVDGDKRCGSFSRSLTRARLDRYMTYLQKSPRWVDLSLDLRTEVLRFAEKYLQQNCYWTEVRVAKKLREKRKTYDFRVPVHHKFMAGGLLNHNSGKCVYGDTLVRTYDGLVRIDSLFAKYPVGIERVGRFGHVYTPFGMREIRGLYSKVVDRTVEVLLQSGLKLGGTEVHPVMVLDGVIARWTELGKLRGDECVLLPTCIPVEINGTALSVEDAVIVAAIATRARRDKLASGVVEIPLEDLRFSTSVQSAFYRKYRVGCNSEGRIAAPLDTVSCTDCVSSAYPWLPRSIYRASPESTRALLRSVYDGARTVGDHRVAVLPRPLAEVVHLGLLGFGVWTTIEHHADGSHIAMPADCDLSSAFSAAAVSAVFNEHSSRSPYGLTDRVLSVKFVNEPRTVYDLAVPSVKSFVTNGIASHNTVIGVKCALLHRERTFITASQIDFLRQFGMRFGENSNAIELYRQGKRPVVIVDKKGWKDAHKYGVHVVKKWGKETSRADVVLSPYQQFIHPERGHERLRQHISGKFATVEVDECIRADTPVVVNLIGETISASELALQNTPVVVSRSVNGELRIRPVTRIIRKRARELIRLEHVSGVVWCTSNHPIWIKNRRAWVPAGEVRVGDEVDLYPSRYN